LKGKNFLFNRESFDHSLVLATKECSSVLWSKELLADPVFVALVRVCSVHDTGVPRVDRLLEFERPDVENENASVYPIRVGRVSAESVPAPLESLELNSWLF